MPKNNFEELGGTLIDVPLTETPKKEKSIKRRICDFSFFKRPFCLFFSTSSDSRNQSEKVESSRHEPVKINSTQDCIKKMHLYYSKPERGEKVSSVQMCRISSKEKNLKQKSAKEVSGQSHDYYSDMPDSLYFDDLIGAVEINIS